MTKRKPYEPASAMRAAMATVTANLGGDHVRSLSLTNDLDEREARFALLVLAEYLSQAMVELSVVEGRTATEVWQRYCLKTEQAITRAAHGSTTPR